MELDLTGKHALVTGSSGGIGLAIAKRLAEAGASVTLNGRNAEKLKKAVESVAAVAPDEKLKSVVADLGTAEGCDQLLKGLEGDCDILVNNAGIFGGPDFFEADDALWQKYWDVNVMSGVRLSRALAQRMVEKGWGRIMFLGSESSFNIPVDMIHYGVTKAAYVALARGLAKRLAGTEVTVNSILPGPTMSEGMVGTLDLSDGKTPDEAARAFIAAKRPSSILRRPATVEEVANMVLYIASPLSAATTGGALRVDGGVVDSTAP